MLTKYKITIRNEILKSFLVIPASLLLAYILTSLFAIPFTSMDALRAFLIPLLILPFFIIPNYNQKKKIIDTNLLLKEMVDEKDRLIHEVHHRVKNNLSIVLSLLNLQKQKPLYKSNPEYSRLNFERRIQTMSLVYDHILRSANLATVNLKDFLFEQRDSIIDLVKNPYIQIDLETEPNNLTVSLANAIPVGLIISEICMNSFQHAFPGRDEGNITIKALSLGSSTNLTIEDNGIGIPPEVISNPADTLGLKLVAALADQVGGKYKIKNKSGTVFNLIYAN